MDVSSVCPSTRRYWQTGVSEKGKGRLAAAVFLRPRDLPRDEKKDMQCTDDSISGQVKCCESVFHARTRSRRLQMPNGKKSGTSGA